MRSGALMALTGTTTAAGFAAPVSVTGQNLKNLSVTNVASSNAAITLVDTALGRATNVRIEMGAMQNRLDSTISNLSQAVESLYQSRSRIVDADFAQETAAMTRAQILQQAGTAMLSQANSLPQNVLSLLQ